MTEEKESAQVFLDRCSRATRGKRLTKLVEEDIEADEEFWGQEAFKEVAEDALYEAEDEVIDEFDSDFDEDEANVDEEEALQDEVERVKKKRLLPPGSKPLKKDKKKATTPKSKGLDVIEAAVAAAVESKDDEPMPVERPSKPIQDEIEFMEMDEGEKIVRKSTRTAVVIRQAEREALRAAMQATAIKPVKKKREGERRITQEDMLLEAAQTEILNQQHLERMLAREEEVKQKAIVHKAVYNGPQIRFYSREGNNVLEFIGPVSEPQQLFGQFRPRNKRAQVCAVTGLPAKYIDPLTGLPYATIEAFKTIRTRINEDDLTRRERTSGKKLKALRSGSGRSLVRKPRKSFPNFFQGLYGELGTMDARVLSRKLSMSEEAEQLYVSEALAPNDNNVDRMTQPSMHDAPLHTSQGVEVAENRLIFHVSNAPAARLEPQSGPCWVDIPAPVEGPSEDDYLLDDLTSLEFGPILASQHNVTSQSQRDEELEFVDLAYEGTLPLDVLPMPPEFGSNAIL